MGDIDWQRLYRATNTDNRPTPGYVFNEIIVDVSNAQPRHIPAVATYLADCVDGDHAHVKLKALFVIKALAYRVPPFCRCMQERQASIEEACEFTGPPSEVYGDEPYRLVREAANSALTALTSGEHYHEQYREMSQRIVGFGNFLPPEDTVLPDGSVDVGITYRDVLSSAFDYVCGGVGSVVGGVKDVFVGSGRKVGSTDVGLSDDNDLACDAGTDIYGTGEDGADCEELVDEDDSNIEDYKPSAGSYVPPMVPPPTEPIPQSDQPWEDLLRCEDSHDAAGAEEDEFMKLLGLDEASGAKAPPRADGPSTSGGTGVDEDEVLTEADILRVLGLDDGSSQPPCTGATGVEVSPLPDQVNAQLGEHGLAGRSSFEFLNTPFLPAEEGQATNACNGDVRNASSVPELAGPIGVPLTGSGLMEV